jgi:hypothetical protein
MATSVYYNWDLTRKREKDRRHHNLMMVLREFPSWRGPNARTCYHCGQEGNFKWECPWGGQPGRYPWPPLGPWPLCKGNHWKSHCPHLHSEKRPDGSTECFVLGPLVQAPVLVIQIEEHRVVLMVEKHKVIFLLDSGAHFSVILFSPGPRSNNKVSVWSILGQFLEWYFTQSLACSWGNLHSCHSFLLVPYPLVGKGPPVQT